MELRELGIDTLVYCATMIEVGFQAILFMLLSRTFAIQEGLYPIDRTIAVFNRVFGLERGVVLGVALIAAGVAIAGRAFGVWFASHFGDLDVESVTRIVIVSAVFISLGFEITLSSFLLATLKLNVRTFAGAENRTADLHRRAEIHSESEAAPIPQIALDISCCDQLLPCSAA